MSKSQTPREYKTPMDFVPSAYKPSPSRHELWKQQLGLSDDSEPEEDQSSNSDDEPEADRVSDKDVVVELQAIKAELKRKDEQREELLLKLKGMTDKTSTYKSRLQKLESSKKAQLKIMKKTHESQLQMKADLINNLEELIEEQERKIDELENRIKGENPVSPTHNDKPSSIKKLVDSINELHSEKSRIHEMWLSTQSDLETVKQDHQIDICCLKAEISDLETKNRKLQAENIKLQNSDENVNANALERYEERVQDLENENATLKKRIRGIELEQHTKEASSLEVQRSLEREGMELRKKVRDLEAKYTNLAATPPKVKKVSVVSEETQKQLDEMIRQNKELESLLSNTRTDLNAKIAALQSDSKTLQASLREVSEKEKKATMECQNLKASLKAKGQVEEAVRQRDTRIQQLEKEVYNYKLDLKAIREAMETHIMELQQENNRLLAEEKAKAEKGSKSWKEKLDRVLLQLHVFAKDVQEIRKENKDLKVQALKMATALKPAIRDTHKKIIQRIDGIDERNKLLVTKYKKEMALRKKYHNELVDLRGNIRVFCRVRPVIREDGGGRPAENVVSFDEDDDALVNVMSKGSLKTFEMDRVFTPRSTQEEVFEEARALVTSCIDGYNVCIFAYGQTGSGKTFTMEGPPSNPGLNQRALRQLFEETEDRSVDWHYCIHVSVMEIYNEMLRDLLCDNPSAKLDIKQGKDGLYVPGLSEVQVASVEDVNEVFALGKRNRATAGTEMNEHSSRSHAILSVSVIGVNKTTKSRTIGKLHLVDLAGSERVSKSGSEGLRMKEAQNINKSLSALGDVIHSLKNEASHVPYRNSKLTYLLQESLGGDSKTLMVVQLSPVEKNVGETVCSLNFAQRVRAVELGQATRKTESAEVAQLKGRLRELEGGSSARTKIPRSNPK